MSVIRTRGCAAHVAVLVLMLLLATSASAAPLPGSAYDSGDGNQDTQLSGDWQSAHAQGRVKISRDRNDDCFIGGVKELSPDGWAFNNSAGGCTPGKSNIRVAYVNPETLASTSYSHFAFFRNDTTGNTFLTFELNRTPATWVNSKGTTIPCRSNGDILLSFEVGGSSLQSVLYRWTGDNSGPPSCPNGANGTFTGSGVIPGSRSQGTLNSAQAITNYVDPATLGTSFPANSFGEAAIDIPAVLQAMGQSPCVAFLQMQVHSRSSSSITSAMIDYTEPVPVNIQSCAAIGEKYADFNANGARDAGENGLPGFEFYADADDDGVRDAGEPTGTSDASGFYRIVDLAAGTHKIREVAKPGWRITAPAPDFYQRALITGGNSVGNDFGNVGPATATGTRFHDLDADGIRDAGELGQAGWTYYADLDEDGVRGASEPSGSSDSNGAWTIENVPAGPQTIRELPQAGWICSAPAGCADARTFVSGATVSGLEFGGWAPASVSGNVFEDLDGDGAALEAGDVGLGVWQVYVDANNNNVFDLGEIQTTTDAAGNYILTGVAPGAHTVRVTAPPAGWYCTRPGATAATCERALTLTSGQLAGGQDFGFSRTATVSGTVFNDADNSGTRGGAEVAWTTATTIFADLNANGLPDGGEPSVATSTGSWTLAGIPAGTVAIRQAPGAFTCTTPAGCAFTPTLTSGQTLPGYEFGNYVATSKAISGTVWLDSNANNLKDATETTGVAGITVYADDDDDGVFDATEGTGVTNSAGAYVLTTTANGNVKVRIKLDTLGVYTCSFPVSCFNNVTGLGNGQSYAGRDFGVYGPASLSGTLTHDLNANGVKDAGETAGLAGRTIYDDADNDSTFDATERSATTAADGTYAITGLNPGSHTIRIVTAAGYTCSSPGPCSHAVTMASADISGRDFLSWTPATISGTVFEDADADGAAREPGEIALGGRTVYLDANNNSVKDITEISVASDVTTGAYSFDAVVPGSHTVRQVLPAGWVQDTPAGAYTVAAVSGALNAGRDFSSHTTATISGRVFDDADFQGDPFEAGDAGLAGRTVYLDADTNGQLDGGESTVITDGSGNYTLTVGPGSYTVRTVPANADRACASPGGCAYAVTVTSGSSYAGRDFGSYVGATVSGTLFEDADADGQPWEGGEPPAQGLRVYLDADNNGVREPSEPTMLTAADGSYSFRGVTAQSWAVRLDLGGGWTCDSPSAPCAHAVVLTSGATQPGKDFGVHTTATISGHLFTDRDNDGGAQVFGENDQPGRTVYVDANGNDVLDGGDTQTVTDELGNYSFAGLQPGDYEIRQVLPAGWQPSVPADGLRTVTVVSGETKAAQNFSSWTTADITGRVFEDTDADGEFPEAGEPGLSPRTVYLDTTPNGSFDGGEPSAVTGADGSFAFDGLAPGTYTVRPVVPATWSCSYPASCSAQLVVEAGEVAQDIHFGLWTNATLAGAVYSDTDGDGDRDGGEGPLANRLVFVDLDGDTTPGAGEPSQTTGADGGYAFALRPGTSYTVIEVPAPGWVCTTAPCALTASVSSGQVFGSLDFGNQPDTATVSGRVAIDADGDGTAGPGEPPLNGWTVFADIDGDGEAGPGEPVGTTALDGTYVLDNVAQGTRTIRVSAPAGWTCSSPCSRSIVLAPGSTTPNVDFALYQAASIAGHTVNDLNGNGVDDPGEPGKGNWTMYLDADDDGMHDAGEPTAITDPAGDYRFDNLVPATYRVRPAVTAGFTCTKPSQCVYVNALVSGENATARDFALVEAARVWGAVYADLDADGVRDGGDGGRPGRIVWVDYDNDGTVDPAEPFATTDAGGSYTIVGVSPGQFRVRYDAPAGEHISDPAADHHVVTFASGDVVLAKDFGSYVDAVISGAVYDDNDNSGDRQAGENGISNKTVQLDAGADGSIEDTTTTDVNGAYTFAGRTPGSYRVTVVIGAGNLCAAPAPCRWDRTVTSGATSAGNDFAIYRVPVADLSLTKSAPATIDQNETFDYTLVATNNGPDAAQSVSITDTLPAGVQFVEVSAGCAYAAPTVTCTVGTLANGASATRTITVEAIDAGAIANSASVSSPTGDPTPADDSDNADVTVAPVADLRMVKTGPETVAAGALATYTVTVHNDGPSTADGVVLRDEIPTGMTFDGSSDAGWTLVSPGVYENAVGSIASGSSKSRDIVLRARHAAADSTQFNSASVDATTTDNTPDNDSDAAVTAVGPSANLAITKTVDDETIAQGADAVYTLTLTNNGPSAAANVTVTDVLPAGMTFVSLPEPGGFDCTTPTVGSGGSVTCSTATLPSAAVVTFTLTVRATTTGTRLNSADVTSTTPDADLTDNGDSVSAEVAPTADVSITKTASETVVAGENVTYAMTVSNNGPSAANNVAVSDTLPDGMTFISLTHGAGANCTLPAVGSGGTIDCTIATLAADAQIELSLVARATFATAEQTLENTATASADEFDPQSEGNESSAETVVGPAVDLRLTKTASVPAALQNSQLTYTLTAFNDGPSDATNVTVTDTLPSGMSFVSGSAGCSESAGTVTCELGDIADGSNAVATITVRANGSGTQVNNATVASDDPDPDPSDDSASATVEVGPVADLSIVKTSSPSVTAGGQLTYTLTAHNAGPSPATGVTVVDVLPSGMTYAGSTSPQGGCAFAAGTVTCSLGGLANGASATATITATATFALSGTTVPNSASISGDQNDDGPANNASTYNVDVGPAADLVLTDDAPAHVPAGGQLLHSLQLSNSGPQTAANSTFTVTLPAGVTFVSAIPTQGSCSASGQIVTCIVGDLPAGSAMQVLLAVSAADTLGGSDVAVSAVASSDTTEIDEPSNRDGATTRVDPAPVLAPPDNGAAAPAAAAPAAGDLRITKTADSSAKAVLGQAIAYTISVTNAANRIAHGVVVADQPSAAVSIGSVRPDKGTCTGLTCRLGDLGAGEVVRIRVVMTPKTAGTFENAAVASSDDGERAVADNRAVAGVSVASARTTLSLKKTVDRKVVRAGGTVWFTITARNTGRETASDVRVCDRPAFNTTFVSVRGARFTRGRACWTTASLQAGARLRYRVKVRVSGTERSRAMTDATVTASNADSRRARRGVLVIAREVLAGAGVTG